VAHNLPEEGSISPVDNMGPRDRRLFLPVKKHRALEQFATNADGKQAATFSFQTFGTNFYAGIQVLLPRWDRRLNISCHHAEVWCVPSASHVSCATVGTKVMPPIFFLYMWYQFQDYLTLEDTTDRLSRNVRSYLIYTEAKA